MAGNASDSHSPKLKSEKDDALGTESQTSDDNASGSPRPHIVALSKEELELERRAKLKLDLTVLPVMTVFYLLSFLVSIEESSWLYWTLGC